MPADLFGGSVRCDSQIREDEASAVHQVAEQHKRTSPAKVPAAAFWHLIGQVTNHRGEDLGGGLDGCEHSEYFGLLSRAKYVSDGLWPAVRAETARRSESSTLTRQSGALLPDDAP